MAENSVVTVLWSYKYDLAGISKIDRETTCKTSERRTTAPSLKNLTG